MAPSMTASASYLLKKGQEGLSIEALIIPVEDGLAVTDANCTKVADSFLSGMMKKSRIGYFWRNSPHPASRTMMFEPGFVHSLQVDSIIIGQIMKFFYMPPAFPDQHAPSSGEAYEAGAPDLDIGAGIAVRKGKLPSSAE